MRKLNLMYLLLAAVVVLSSCSKSAQTAKFIPADAVVLSIDVKQMMEKGKLADNAEAKKKLMDNIEQNSKNQETKDLFKKIVEDPAKAGVDLREPILVYTTADTKDMGVVGAILSKDDFAEVLNAVAKEGGMEAVKEKDGIQYLQDKESIIAFDDAIFFATEGKKIEDIAAKFTNDDTKGTMVENEDFAKLEGGKGFMKALIPLAIAEGQVDANVKKQLPEGCELKDLAIIMDLSTDKGVAKLDIEALPKSDAWKNYIKQGNEISKKIDGDYIKFIPKGAFAMFANFNGSKLYEQLEKNGAIKEAGLEGEKEMLKKVLDAIDGDIAIGVGDYKGGIPNVAGYMKTKDKSIIELAEQSGMKPEKGMDFGFKDGATYIAVGETTAFADAKETFDAGIIKGHKAYLFLDVSIIGTIGDMMGNSTAKMGAEAAKQYIKSLECYDTGETQFELVLNMADAEKDPIEFFINLALQQF